MIRSLVQLGAVAGVVVSLSGCSLLSTPDPVQLYRFGLPMDAPSAEGDTPAPLSV